MKRVYSFRGLIAVVFCLFLTAGCGGNTEKRYRIGVSQCSGDYWRVKINDDIMREQLLHDDVEVEFRNADSDNNRQISDIRYFMDNGFDLIMVSPNETEELTPIVKESYEKGIPVVTFDRRVDGDSFTAHMEVDNYELGKSVAGYARSHIQKPLRVIEIQGPTSASPARRRHEGFADAMKDYDDSEILASVYGNWDDGLSECLVDSLLKIYPETNLIYAHTDHMGIGASRAVRKNGRRDIAVMGIDGFPEIGIKAVKDSVLTASFLYPSEGERLLRIGMAILKGEPYEKITQVPPLSPIDLSNADILIAQEKLLTGETEKINFLRGALHEYWIRHSAQTMLLYAFVIILVLLAGVLFLLLRAVNVHKRHKGVLLQKNTQLEEEKEKQQELYDRLREATQSKLMFYTNVSHDLRTPLTLISGPVEEVARDESLSQRDRQLMQIAQKNVSILRRLIDQILDFRKYENNKTDLHLSEVDLPALLREWAEAFKEAANKRDIRLAVNIAPVADPYVGVDVEKMERVFFNLMSNAFKHTPDNGKISVAYVSDGTKFTFSVKDNGEGISEEDCRHIFDRFFQADKVNPKGSGIGLALTKAFVELHGGEISVDSEKGKGSEFKVALPVRHCGNKVEAPQSRITSSDIDIELSPIEKDGEEFDSKKPLLLVVDDNRDIHKLIGALLGADYNVIYASDGQQGVKMAVKYVPDLVVCDVMMPVMDGMECVKRIKSEITTSHIPVLMLTACSLDEQRVEGYDNGADGYLPKPFGGDVLASRCRNLLMNRKRIKSIYGKGAIAENEKDGKGRAIPRTKVAPNDVESDFYTRFMKIVESRMSDPKLSIEEIAGEMGLSQSQFTRKIKALANYTPVEIIRTVRLQMAKTILSSTEKTVSEISFEVGFTSLAYFSKCYKEEFGESPSAIRGKK